MKLNKILKCMLAALLVTPFAGIACSSPAITDSRNRVYQGRTRADGG